MIVDSPALIAILIKEPDYAKIACADLKRMGPPSLLEACIVLNREKGVVGVRLLREFISESSIQIVPFTEADAAIAFDAYLRFGKGLGHPAQLNILDGCAYALAARSKESLLCQGMDFARTDLIPAWQAGSGEAADTC
jgi:ribonuclease VapC